METRLPAALLARLAQLSVGDALDELRAESLFAVETAGELAAAALDSAEADPAVAAHFLLIATGVNNSTTTDPGIAAQLAYAQARVQLISGELDQAEASLRDARQHWAETSDRMSWARSGLGLTQVLAIQGRYAEAESAIRSSIDAFLAINDPDVAIHLHSAQHNLATLLSYQERHEEALALNRSVRSALALIMESAAAEALPELRQQAAQAEMGIALALTYLDDPIAAETALRTAIDLLPDSDLAFDRGRARTNLGHLFVRTGRYAAAVATFDQATEDIFGSFDVDSLEDRWPQADVLFLEQAVAFLALNLLPEALAALRRAEQLFRSLSSRYELGQVLYYLGLASSRTDEDVSAIALLAEAATNFRELNNLFWLHRVTLAQAGLALHQGDLAESSRLVVQLLQETGDAPGAPAIEWDRAMLAELHLLHMRIERISGNLVTARSAADAAALALGLETIDSEGPAFLPHLYLHLLHQVGQLARVEGDAVGARQYFAQAIELLEEQRATLPLEELRTAFLADKTAIYTDLVLSLLDTPIPDAGTVAEAFAVVERARSRSLLERLLVSVDEAELDDGQLSPEMRAQMETIRQQLYWLYNQLTGDGTGSRRAAPALSTEIREREAALQRLEWHAGALLTQAEPVSLARLQAALPADQQAIMYYFAGDEIMAFVTARDQVKVVRRLGTTRDLNRAQADLRFQIGRVEIGGAFVDRHGPRLLRGVRSALVHLYDLLIAPVEPLLSAERLLVIPYGSLHLLPFHALWNGAQYLLSRFECTYASSASIAVHRHQSGRQNDYGSLSALAIHDEAIPQALSEAEAAASFFPRAAVYLDDRASLAGLQAAAGESEVLHIATHGLFRPDNPFFSALKLADGWIDVRQIYRLPLQARMVVLSACESGAVQVQGGDEVVGLARGFLGAGAETLLVSLWNVHDVSAAVLMKQFYAHLTDVTGCRPATALRTVQRRAAYDDQHPYFWAPYTVIG